MPTCSRRWLTGSGEATPDLLSLSIAIVKNFYDLRRPLAEENSNAKGMYTLLLRLACGDSQHGPLNNAAARAAFSSNTTLVDLLLLVCPSWLPQLRRAVSTPYRQPVQWPLAQASATWALSTPSKSISRACLSAHRTCARRMRKPILAVAQFLREKSIWHIEAREFCQTDQRKASFSKAVRGREQHLPPTEGRCLG